MKKPIPEFAPPLCVYLTFLLAALAIGNEHSCNGGLEFYTILGISSMPALLVFPFSFSKSRDPLIQFVMSAFYLLLGILAWAGSFLLGGMVFMCRLF
ncbi:MAG: hypothetical protein ABIQ08_10770 [Duganella sp.]